MKVLHLRVKLVGCHFVCHKKNSFKNKLFLFTERTQFKLVENTSRRNVQEISMVFHKSQDFNKANIHMYWSKASLNDLHNMSVTIKYTIAIRTAYKTIFFLLIFYNIIFKQSFPAFKKNLKWALSLHNQQQNTLGFTHWIRNLIHKRDKIQ